MILTAKQLERVADGTPLHFTEPPVETEFVVIRADVFERARRIFDEAGLSGDETRALMWRTMRDDWDDPLMDAYDAMGEQ